MKLRGVNLLKVNEVKRIKFGSRDFWKNKHQKKLDMTHQEIFIDKHNPFDIDVAETAQKKKSKRKQTTKKHKEDSFNPFDV